MLLVHLHVRVINTETLASSTPERVVSEGDQPAHTGDPSWCSESQLSSLQPKPCHWVSLVLTALYLILPFTWSYRSFLHSWVSQESACNAGDLGSIPGSGRSPGEGNSNPLQYSCLENPTDRGAWQVTVHGVTRVGHDLVTKPPPPHIHTYNWITLLYA